MNNSAERHLAKATEYIAIAEADDPQGSAYEHAALEIEAAMQDDPKLTQEQVGKKIGKTQQHVSRLLAALADAREYGGDFRVDWASGSNKRDNVTAKFLTDASLEQVEQVIAQLPPERVQGVAAAAGNAYHKARQEYRETERDLTPAKRKEREAAGEAMTRPVVSAVSSFTIISRLEVALEELRELNASGEVPAQMIEPLGRLINELVAENRVTRAMAGLDIDLDEVRT